MRRSINVTRRAARSSSTAAKLAPRSLERWERPQSTNSDNSEGGPSTIIPRSKSWARPEQAAEPSWSSVLPVLPSSTGGNKWARPQTQSPGAAAQKYTPRSVPEPRRSTQTPRRDLGPRRSGPRELPPHQAGLTGDASRAPLPHQTSSARSGRSLPPHLLPRESVVAQDRAEGSKSTARGRPRPSVSALSSILAKDRIHSGIVQAQEEAQEEEEEGEENENEEAPIHAERQTRKRRPPVIAEEVPDNDLEDDHRGGKHGPHGKENGSILARVNRSAKQKDPTHQAPREKEKKPKTLKQVRQVKPDVFIPSVVSVGNLARLLGVRLDQLRRKMISVGMEAEASYDFILTAEYASLLAMEYKRNPVVNDEAAFDIYPSPVPADPSSLPYRPPVVTIMGHVDHGKTTLLDTLRSTSVAKGEAGGITQHIGAFSVPVPAGSGDKSNTKTITFLDTPGHAAFSAMRARGARVTDTVVLVVAADDGVMPQTKEVIELIKKDNMSTVVAVNKIDKPGADPNRVESALMAEGIQLETFGGDVPVVQVSGLTGQGLDQLVETISLVAEMKDLRAEAEGKVHGYVIESKVQKGLGPVATVLVVRGSLKPGDHVICGLSHAKVRILTDSTGKSVLVARPGMAVTVSGWKELPNAGDEVLQGAEAEVKKALTNRIRKAEIEATLAGVDALNEQRQVDREQREREKEEEGEETLEEKVEDGPKQLNLIIKGDVSGTVEAVAGALQGIGNHLARVKIVSTGVGDVTESDILRAKAVNGTVIAFSVNTPRSVQSEASSQQVPIISSTIIYRLMDTVKDRVAGLLPPIIERRVTGEASVLQIFEIHLKGRQTMKVAGCRVTNGVVEKSRLARVVRNGDTVHEGRLETMKHLKRDITEASKGTECGLAFAGWDDLVEGDTIQMYQEVEKPAIL